MDPDGRAAGDLFDTMDEAAVDFAKEYNDDSIRKQKEFGSSIYRNEEGKYFYTIPTIGRQKAVTPSIILLQKPVATIHTHTEGERMDVFSDVDLIVSNKRNLISYLVISSGGIFKYDPSVKMKLLTAYSEVGNPKDITTGVIPSIYNYEWFDESPAKHTVFRKGY